MTTYNRVVSLGDFPTGGSIGAASATWDVADTIVIAQTTTSKLLTFATPTYNGFPVFGRVVNSGTARLWTPYKRMIPSRGAAWFMWLPTVGWSACDLGVQVLAESGLAQAYPTDTNANDITLITIPGGFLGTNDAVQYKYLVDNTSGTSSKTLVAKFGGSAISSNSGILNSVIYAWANDKTIRNANSISAQTGSASGLGNDVAIGGVTVASVLSLSVNTANDVACAINVQKGTGSDVTTLRYYEVIYHPAP